MTAALVPVVIVNPRPPEPGENKEESVAKTRERLRWDQDDEICRGHILNGMSNTLFDAYHTVKTAKELWNQLERRYITEDATSKRFIVSKFFYYKMVDDMSVMEQFNEIKSILDRYSQHKLALDEFIVVTSIIDKLPPSWKNFRNSLKHRKEDINLDELVYLAIVRDLDEPRNTDHGPIPSSSCPCAERGGETLVINTHSVASHEVPFPIKNSPGCQADSFLCFSARIASHKVCLAASRLVQQSESSSQTEQCKGKPSQSLARRPVWLAWHITFGANKTT
ncbi:hypothetical protein RJ639_042741 [Escallonia herrerae]|uniref:Zinc finger, CCHC-type n=1 Tax=Escallonia herrerae TaxID=1293975 RepID=A0AA89B7R1_9ASTE|nr:hypothetical protein RJ639_042741 [Escallonia herrerae]